MGRMDCYPGEYLHPIILTAQYSLKKSSLKKEGSGKNGTATGHQQAKITK
jgi:hypothetical protein